MAGECPRLVDQPQPLLGFTHPGVAVRRSDVPAHRRVRLDRPTRSRLRRDGDGPAPTRRRRPLRPNPDDPTGQSTMRRVPEVLDCWFESGSMPFAQVHYPFENTEWFEHHYPGDFIVEYIGQTRGWFYTLHVLATALFDRPAFRTCVSHGNVLGDDGHKMSKSLNNYPDPRAMFDDPRRRRHAVASVVVCDPARQRRDCHRLVDHHDRDRHHRDLGIDRTRTRHHRARVGGRQPGLGTFVSIPWSSRCRLDRPAPACTRGDGRVGGRGRSVHRLAPFRSP